MTQTSKIYINRDIVIGLCSCSGHATGQLYFSHATQSSHLTELPVPIRLCAYFDVYFISLRMFYISFKLVVILSQNANVDVRKDELGF